MYILTAHIHICIASAAEGKPIMYIILTRKLNRTEHKSSTSGDHVCIYLAWNAANGMLIIHNILTEKIL